MPLGDLPRFRMDGWPLDRLPAGAKEFYPLGDAVLQPALRIAAVIVMRPPTACRRADRFWQRPMLALKRCDRLVAAFMVVNVEDAERLVRANSNIESGIFPPPPVDRAAVCRCLAWPVPKRRLFADARDDPKAQSSITQRCFLLRRHRAISWLVIRGSDGRARRRSDSRSSKNSQFSVAESWMSRRCSASRKRLSSSTSKSSSVTLARTFWTLWIVPSLEVRQGTGLLVDLGRSPATWF